MLTKRNWFTPSLEGLERTWVSSIVVFVTVNSVSYSTSLKNMHQYDNHSFVILAKDIILLFTKISYIHSPPQSKVCLSAKNSKGLGRVNRAKI